MIRALRDACVAIAVVVAAAIAVGAWLRRQEPVLDDDAPAIPTIRAGAAEAAPRGARSSLEGTEHAPVPRVEFRDQGRVFGRVMDVAGAPVVGAIVSLRRAKARESNGAVDDGRTRTTDDSGRFEFDDFAPDDASLTAELTAEAEGFRSTTAAATAGVEAVVTLPDDGVPWLRIRVHASPAPPPTLRVVLAPTGALERKYGGLVSEFTTSVIDGACLIRGPFPEPVVDAVAFADGYAYDVVKKIGVSGTSRRRPAEIDVRLSTAGAIVGEAVLEGEGRDPASIIVGVWSAEAKEGGPQHAPPQYREFGRGRAGRTNVRLLADLKARFVDVAPVDGRARFKATGLSAGDYYCAVVGPDSMPRSDVARIAVVDGALSGPVSLVVRRGVQVVVKVAWAGRNIPAMAQARPMVRGRVMTAVVRDGRSTFADAAPGRYEITPGFQWLGGLGAQYARLNGAAEQLLHALWLCGGKPAEAAVETDDVAVEFSLDPLVAGYSRWHLERGAASIAAEVQRQLSRQGRPTRVAIDDPSPYARVAERLIALGARLAALGVAEASELPPGFIAAVAAMDLEKTLTAMTVDA